MLRLNRDPGVSANGPPAGVAFASVEAVAREDLNARLSRRHAQPPPRRAIDQGRAARANHEHAVHTTARERLCQVTGSAEVQHRSRDRREFAGRKLALVECEDAFGIDAQCMSGDRRGT